MKPPSTALLRAFSPFWRSETFATRSAAKGCLSQQHHQTPLLQQASNFSTTQTLQKRNKGPKIDQRITLLRYFLSHGLTPRPLRWSRNRALRHWTIHRAWQLSRKKLHRERELELERQYNSMASACEALRNMDDRGLTAEESERIGATPPQGKELGRLYRIAMIKEGVWDNVPIEYARIQTESPPRDGFNEDWTR